MLFIFAGFVEGFTVSKLRKFGLKDVGLLPSPGKASIALMFSRADHRVSDSNGYRPGAGLRAGRA